MIPISESRCFVVGCIASKVATWQPDFVTIPYFSIICKRLTKFPVRKNENFSILRTGAAFGIFLPDIAESEDVRNVLDNEEVFVSFGGDFVVWGDVEMDVFLGFQLLETVAVLPF